MKRLPCQSQRDEDVLSPAPSKYFDPIHKAAVARLQRSLTARSEWPTYLLAATIYGGWFETLAAIRHAVLPSWITSPILVVLLVWYMSLQHELLHGHASRSPEGGSRITINDAGIVMRMLFLNNNSHLIHRELPPLAWYQLPAAYRLRETAYRQRAGSFRIAGGYRALLKRYAFLQTDAPVHPDTM